MKIVIAGAGDVGYHLAKLLAFESHSAVLIDTQKDRLQHVSEHLDVSTLLGDTTSYEVLKEAGVAKSQLFIAATSNEAGNITACIIAKFLGADRTIARITKAEYLKEENRQHFKELGIDELISPEFLASQEIERLLDKIGLTDTFEFENGLLSLVGVTINADSLLLNRTSQETAYLNPQSDFLTVAITRKNETLIPRGSSKFALNDHVYFISKPVGLERITRFDTNNDKEIRKVIVLGASKLGVRIAESLHKKYKVKLIEVDKDRCLEVADQLDSDILIIHGDANDVDLLKEEGIEDTDAFIAVTGNSETNIISCLVAKKSNVAKTIALVKNVDYFAISQEIGVDSMINKKLLAADFIFRYVRQGEVLAVNSLPGVDAEVLEFEIKHHCKMLKAPLQELGFPKEAIVAGVVRDNEGMIVLGTYQFKLNDRVVVFCKPEAIHEVESFFR
jgi:trk system potassium uptake protein TrkA